MRIIEHYCELNLFTGASKGCNIILRNTWTDSDTDEENDRIVIIRDIIWERYVNEQDTNGQQYY